MDDKCSASGAEPPAIVEIALLSAQASRMLADLHRDIALTPRHLMTLFALQAADRLAQQDLAQVMGVHSTKLVGILNDLEARHLIRRVRDDDDRRRHFVHLTDAGAHRLRDVIARVDALDAELLSGLTAPERGELSALLRAGRSSRSVR